MDKYSMILSYVFYAWKYCWARVCKVMIYLIYTTEEILWPLQLEKKMALESVISQKMF